MALSTKTMRGLIRYLPGTGKVKGAAVPRLIIHPGDTTPVYEPFYIRPTEVPSGTLAAGAIWFDDDNNTIAFFDGTANKEVPKVTAGTAARDLIFNFLITPAATVTEKDFLIVPYALQVTGIQVVPSTLQGGAATATIVKAVSTATPVKTTTPLHTADAIDLNAGAYTVQTITLTATAADLVFAAGNRISVDYSTAITAGHAVVTITYKLV